MKTRTMVWVGIGLGALILAVVVGWQRDRALKLAAERDLLIGRQLRLAGKSGRQPRGADEELARLRRQHEEVQSARESLARVEQALARAKGQPAPPINLRENPVPTEPMLGPMLKSTEWRDAGAMTPQAALESLVWAATSGETGRLSELLAIDEAGRKQLAEAFGLLSEEARASYGTPEQMLATLLAVQVPQDLSAIGSVSTLNLSNGDIVLRTRTERGGAIARDASLVFRLANGHWQLVVPREVAIGALTSALKTAAPGPR